MKIIPRRILAIGACLQLLATSMQAVEWNGSVNTEISNLSNWTVDPTTSRTEQLIEEQLVVTEYLRECHKWVWSEEKHRDPIDYFLWAPNLQGTGLTELVAFGNLYFGHQHGL